MSAEVDMSGSGVVFCLVCPKGWTGSGLVGRYYLSPDLATSCVNHVSHGVHVQFCGHATADPCAWRWPANLAQTRAMPGVRVLCRNPSRLAWLSLCLLHSRSGKRLPLGRSGATQNNNGSAQMNSLSEKAGASAPGHSPASPVAANLDTLRLAHADYRSCVGNVGSSISMLHNGGRHDA